jgi:transmembrane sensor
VHASKPDSIEEILTIVMSGGPLTPQQSVAFDTWIAESADHRARFDQLRATWQVLGRRELELPPYRPIDIAAPSARRPALAIARIGRWRRATWAATGLAAALAAFVVQRSVSLPGSDRVQHYATEAGHTLDVRLEDGTLIRLAPGSRLDVTLGSQGRDVRLKGRAFFAVAHQAGRPFRVHTSSGDVKVLGTRFNVSSDGARLQLVVVDGRVELSSGTRRVEVVGGQVSHAEEGTVAAAVAIPDVYASLEWMGRTMIFNATPLPRVADEIEHRFGVRVEIDSSLAAHTVTAVFNDRRLPDVLDVLCGLVDATCDLEPGSKRVRISARAERMSPVSRPDGR